MPDGSDQDGSAGPRQPASRPLASDLVHRERLRGSHGDQRVRVARHPAFRRVAPGYLVPRPGFGEPTTGIAGAWVRFKHFLLGDPIATALEHTERLTKVKALAVFSSDALSSVAYATEEIMKVLVLAGLGAMYLTLPIAAAIAVLLAIVVVSYRQTIAAYPNGGGSYIVANDNLGTLPGVTAAAALLIDYVLTVSVSVAAGVAAVTSALPDLTAYTVILSVAAVALIALGNLRGIRESGTIFAVPTYAFVVSILVLIGWGLLRLVQGPLAFEPPPPIEGVGTRPLGLFLLLSAFAQGCTAMTGVEAVSNGVPAFKAPESRNARTTLVWMGVLLGSMFLGLSYLAVQIGVMPSENETVVSQIARAVSGRGWFYYVVQATTALILVLAANTSFADFPRLASILARDRFMPRVFAFRGDRLAFSNGIIVLAALSIVLLIHFGGSVDALIPLYAVGVFTSFTLSQAGMVQHWRKLRGPHWLRHAVVNGVGAVTTAIVTLIIAVTKFQHGAWLVCVLIPILIVMFLGIHRHYTAAEQELESETPVRPEQVKVRAVVPVAGINTPARQALAFARALTPNVSAVHVTEDPKEAEALRAEWDQVFPGVELVVVESPYRALTGPLLAYLDALRSTHPKDTLMVILPEFVPAHWWEHLLHNQTALRLKASLLFEPGIIVANVPYHQRKEARKPAPAR